MTTSSFSTRVRHDSDANYNEWAAEFFQALSDIGLVQTADTGQVSVGALTRPGAGSYSGYQIWRFDDSLQGSAPIYLKFEIGTANGASSTAAIRVSVGTGTDGAGTLTQTGMSGTLTTAREINLVNTSHANNDTAHASHFCHTEGYLGISWKNDGTTNTAIPGLFFICRTSDAGGTADGRGAMIYWPRSAGGTPITQSVRFTATAAAYTVQTTAPGYYLGLFPQAQASTVVSGDNQVALGWTITPLAEPLHGLVGCYPSEISHAATFSVAPKGSTTRTFIALAFAPFGAPSTAIVGGLWE